MSGADRTAFRTAARAALQSAPHFAAYTSVSAWAVSLDAAEAPFLAVATPQERQSRETYDTARCELTMAVVLKVVAGDGIEDALDAACDAAEAAVTAALRDTHIQCDLTAVVSKIDGGGEQRVGTVDLSFAITYWVDDPAPI